MRVCIAGGHGQIGLRLIRRLTADEDAAQTGTERTEAVGLIRNPDHVDEIEVAGGEAVICDLESAAPEEIAAAVAGSDVVVFAAGAGPGSGAERKLTMDRDGAIALLRAAPPDARYLMVSAVGAEDPPDGDEVFDVYLQAKAAADAAVRDGDRDWVIVRPGPLSDDPGSGRVRLSLQPFRGEITRDDVAAILVALIADPRLARRRIVYAGDGETPIDTALTQLS